MTVTLLGLAGVRLGGAGVVQFAVETPESFPSSSSVALSRIALICDRFGSVIVDGVGVGGGGTVDGIAGGRVDGSEGEGKPPLEAGGAELSVGGA